MACILQENPMHTLMVLILRGIVWAECLRGIRRQGMTTLIIDAVLKLLQLLGQDGNQIDLLLPSRMEGKWERWRWMRICCNQEWKLKDKWSMRDYLKLIQEVSIFWPPNVVPRMPILPRQETTRQGSPWIILNASSHQLRARFQDNVCTIITSIMWITRKP